MQKAHRVPPDFRSRKVSQEDIQNHDLIVVMNEDNYWHIKNLAPQLPPEKVKLLMEFSKQLGVRSVPDPQDGAVSYEAAYETLVHSAEHLVEFIQKNYQ